MQFTLNLDKQYQTVPVDLLLHQQQLLQHSYFFLKSLETVPDNLQRYYDDLIAHYEYVPENNEIIEEELPENVVKFKPKGK